MEMRYEESVVLSQFNTMNGSRDRPTRTYQVLIESSLLETPGDQGQEDKYFSSRMDSGSTEDAPSEDQLGSSVSLCQGTCKAYVPPMPGFAHFRGRG